MSTVRVSWTGNPFESMTDEEKEILNLGMNLMAMPEDHPEYKSLTHELNRKLSDWEKRKEENKNG